jgi:hypothetical protein
MAVVMRFVQRFRADKRKEFMELEKEFARLEHQRILTPGQRMAPIAARDPGNTLIWESTFKDLAAAEQALKALEQGQAHQELFAKQVPYFEDAWVEFYEVLDF